MEFNEIVKKRRAVKGYDSNHKLTEKEKKNLLTLAMYSPTALNLQHWKFVLIEDKTLLEKLRKVSFDQKQITEASLLVIICCDLKAWKNNAEKSFRNAGQEIKQMIIPRIEKHYTGNEVLQRDEAIRSGSIAAQTLMLGATSMGYDSCPIGGFEHDKVAEIINLPKEHIITLLVTIGKGIEEPHPKNNMLDYDEVVFLNSF